jgi:hypothetical protein
MGPATRQEGQHGIDPELLPAMGRFIDPGQG